MPHDDANPQSIPGRRRRLVIAGFMLAMIIIAASANAVMDTLSFRYDRSVFASCAPSWTDPRISWKNKWKDGDPARGEAFPFSSTALVAVTDAWHCCKSLMLSCLILAVLAPVTLVITLPWPAWLALFAAGHVLWGLVFESLFAGLLMKR